MNKISTYLLWLILLCAFNAPAAIRVVVLGSSTAKGIGASPGNSWVSKYSAYLKTIDPKNQVINLPDSPGVTLSGVGYTTYHIMPTGTGLAGKPQPDTSRNISKALLLEPNLIIINMPTNDADYGFSIAETMANFAAIVALAKIKNIPVYIATPQGRNFSAASQKRQSLVKLKEQINATYGKNSIDFWTSLANVDGTVNPLYDSGDGIHLNDAGHDVLYKRVKKATVALLSRYKSNYK